jgi:hypothetical protein
MWRIPTADEMQIRADLREGSVAFGTHIPPTPDEAAKAAE